MCTIREIGEIGAIKGILFAILISIIYTYSLILSTWIILIVRIY